MNEYLICMLDVVQISKALANQKRVDILGWLKSPETYFPPHQEVEGFEQGVCLAFIKDKAQLSQSTISQYMAQLQQAGLVQATRIGKWTYFKRDDAVIEQYAQYLSHSL